MLTVVPATETHAHTMAPLMRQADVQEAYAVSGSQPLAALLQCLHHSLSAHRHTAVDADDTPVLMFGVAPTEHPEVGAIWMLGTDQLPGYRRQFLKECKHWFAEFHRLYPVLWNCVDARNTVHIRWLKWCGCTFLRSVEGYGYEKRTFLEFIHV